MLFIEIDQNNVIHSISPNCEKLLGHKQQVFVGKVDNADIICENSTIKRMNSDNTCVHFKRENINNSLYVEYVV